jgi:GR25 family glycosyltransferase involved in LPS biosynthesis
MDNDASEMNDILNQNEHCYRFKYMKNTDGLFHKTIDATYVVHLEGNGRYESVMKQLNEYHLTNDVYVLHNKGFKKCDKTSNVVYPADDLVDAFLQIFKHANEKKYENILILEDDFIFTNDVKNATHINNVNNFLIKKTDENESFIYYIGCIPYLTLPVFDGNNTYLSLISCGMHSVVYSKKYRKEFVSEFDKIQSKDWDVMNNFYSMNKYMYGQPLCYQLCTDTENKKTWGNHFLITKCLSIIPKLVINLTGIDKSIEPGYSILYAISKILPIIILLLTMTVIYIVFVFTFSKKYMKKYIVKVNRK